MSDWVPATTPNFSEDEMKCQHCGKTGMRQDFMEMLQELRNQTGFPLTVNSGYRCPDHPIEAAKQQSPGAHAQGRAVDLAWPEGAVFKHRLLACAVRLGFKGVGIEGRFLHLDNGHDEAPRPAFWQY